MTEADYFYPRNSPITIACSLCMILEKELQQAPENKKKECWEKLSEAMAELHKKITQAQEELYYKHVLGVSLQLVRDA